MVSCWSSVSVRTPVYKGPTNNFSGCDQLGNDGVSYSGRVSADPQEEIGKRVMLPLLKKKDPQKLSRLVISISPLSSLLTHCLHSSENALSHQWPSCCWIYWSVLDLHSFNLSAVFDRADHPSWNALYIWLPKYHNVWLFSYSTGYSAALCSLPESPPISGFCMMNCYSV